MLHSVKKISSVIEQKGMTFDYDFVFFFLFSSLLKKEGRRKAEWIAKIVIKSHAFLLDLPFNVNLDFCLLLKLNAVQENINITEMYDSAIIQ